MGRYPVPLTMHMVSNKGLAMQPVLFSGLSSLNCIDEECTLHVADTASAGIEVFLVCRKYVLKDARWLMDHGPEAGKYSYHTVFETESAAEIVDAVKRIVALPDVSGRFVRTSS